MFVTCFIRPVEDKKAIKWKKREHIVQKKSELNNISSGVGLAIQMLLCPVRVEPRSRSDSGKCLLSRQRAAAWWRRRRAAAGAAHSSHSLIYMSKNQKSDT